MAQKKKGKVSVGKATAIGAGMAAVSAGAYYFLGPDGKKHQKSAKNMMVKMEKVLEKKLVKTTKTIKKNLKKA